MSKKIYLIYADKDKINDIYISISMKNNGEFFLYAITDKKEYKKKFLKDRVNIFKVKTMYIDEIDDYDKFKKENSKYYINEYTYVNKFNNRKIKILSTGYEYEEIHVYWYDHIVDYAKLGFLNSDNYLMFEDKYIKLFSVLNLDDMFVMFGDYEYPQDDCEFSYPNNDDDDGSVCLYRALVNSDGENVYHDLIITPNEINIFINLFKKMYK